MCVVAIAWNAHPDWQLLVAGNRDELHSRASAPLDIWDEIIAGRDLVSGGTWMGVSRQGRFAVVTNVRDANGPDPDKLSRGALVRDWLASNELPGDPSRFNPFNLIVVGNTGARFISNRPVIEDRALPAGIHGLSNAISGEHWPRKNRLMSHMGDWLAGSATHPESLLDILRNDSPTDDDVYPLFLSNPIYGSRCSTIVAVNRAGQGRITERSFDPSGAISGERTLMFDWTQ